jgi:hypothetical protein
MAPPHLRENGDCWPKRAGIGIALCLAVTVPEKPIDSSRRRVNHDRSGLWSADPLDQFSSERAAPISPATPLPAPNTRVSLPPVARRAEPVHAKTSVVQTASSAHVSTDRRRLLSFVSGSAFGALVCVILISWLTSFEQPSAEPFTPRPEPVPVPSAPVPVSPPAPDPPSIAERAMRVVINEPPDSPEVKRPAAAPTQKESFVGSLYIDSMPQGARVLIDREPAGVTPLLVRDLRAGSHAVRVDADGHISWSSAIRVIADRETRVHTTLAPLDGASVRR